MATAHKGAISFGLVQIPVSLYTATQDNDISFNQLHKEDNQRKLAVIDIYSFFFQIIIPTIKS